VQERFDPATAPFQEGPAEPAEGLDLDHLLAAARRQWMVVAIATALGLALGVIYVVTAVPQYTATTSILVDSNNKQLVDQLLAMNGGVDDNAEILSQLELLKSDGIADAVIDKLKLADNPEFNAEHGSWVTALHGLLVNASNFGHWFAPAQAAVVSDDEKLRAARDRLESGLQVDRVGQTYVLNVSYTSASPGLAAQIAQAFGDAYLDDQLNSKYDAVRRASGWLQDRIAELKEKSIESDLAVQKFKAEHNLIDTGGQLISDQQLSQLNAQLTAARGATAQAQAKYQHIESIIQSNNMNAAVSDALDDPVITDLRGKYLDASRQEQDIASRLGENHQQAVRLRDQMAEYQRLMFQELGRIAQTYQSTFLVTKAQEASLEDQVAKASGVTAQANDAQVQLRELQRESDTYRNLYQNFLQQYQDAIQKQSFPVTEARIISNAAVPQKPSAPKIPLSLALAGVLGVMVGVGIAGIREFRDRYFRTGEQVRAEPDVDFLGFVPLIEETVLKRDEKRRAVERRRARRKRKPEAIPETGLITRYVVEKPMSLFAETLRAAKLSLDLAAKQKQTKVIGVVSTLPGEGKSVIAMNLAALLAKQGAKTLLIDGDMRNPATTRALAKNAERGLAEALIDKVPVEDLLALDQSSGVAVLPSVSSKSASLASDLLSSPSMDELLGAASGFDYIVVDLPPLGLVVDGRAMASKLDAFLFVVEWGRTSRAAARDTLSSQWLVAEKCIGAVLNKVETNQLHLYGGYGAGQYYYRQYRYYQDRG
jgi:succinoglycan biosynthesis transport protein ExoP